MLIFTFHWTFKPARVEFPVFAQMNSTLPGANPNLIRSVPAACEHVIAQPSVLFPENPELGDTAQSQAGSDVVVGQFISRC